MKKIVVLGSTGSVGTQALDIIKESGRYEVVGLICHSQIELMIEQAHVFKPKYVAVYDETQYLPLKEALKGTGIEVFSGVEGSITVCTMPEADVVITAIVGNAGLIPTVKSIEAGKQIALANKETLVTAGQLIMPLAKKHGVSILPVDSEHSAIFQCLNGESRHSIDRILLTASGGAFRNAKKEEIAAKKAVEALKHPNWSMGQKITIDSATLMNKGLEFIEAKWLFDVTPEQIEVVVHPQSIIHSMVQFDDGVVMAQMGVPDMRLPIIYALDYPNRYPNKVSKLNFDQMAALTFEKPDMNRFPCLGLAVEAIKQGGIMPTVLNAANEVLVDAYLKDKIGFYDISGGVEKALFHYENIIKPTLEDIVNVDNDVRKMVRKNLG